MNPMLLLLYAEAFWQEYHAPVEIVMLLVGSGVFMKWVVDDFRYSRVSAITWILAVSSLLGPVWAAMYVTSPAVQARIDQSRHHRKLILLGSSPHRDETKSRTLPDDRTSLDFATVKCFDRSEILQSHSEPEEEK
jgi:hypothetical protein